jgi:hypothetical protein
MMPRHTASRTTAANVLILAMACGVDAASALPPESHRDPLAPVSLTLVVGTDGKAADIQCTPVVSAALCPVLSRAIGRWQFAPGQRAGQPDAMKASLALDIVPVAVEGGFRLQAKHARLSLLPDAGAASDHADPTRNPPPAYPVDELRRNKTAVVVVEWWFATADAPAHAGQAWRDGREARKGDPFVAAAANAMRQWKHGPHVPEQRSYCTRMEFFTSARNGAGSSLDTGACQPSFAPGFTPPKLLMNVANATF